MSGRPSRSYLVIASAILLAGILISASLFLIIGEAPKTVASTSTSTVLETRTVNGTVTATTTSTITSVFISTNILQLQVSLNATTIRSGGAISAKITVFNPLDDNVSINPDYVANPNVVNWDGENFLCNAPADEPAWDLAGYALFEGHITSANFSTAGHPLPLIPFLANGCLATDPDPSTIVFLPNGSSTVAYVTRLISSSGGFMTRQAVMNATTQACVFQSQANAWNCGSSTSLFGYWTMPPGPIFDSQNATTSSPYFHYFPAGEYTLVVEDLWGQAVYSYFEVTS